MLLLILVPLLHRVKGTLPGSEPHELFQWLKIPMDRLLRAPLDRPHISLAVDEIPAISWSECDSLWGAVNSSIGTFQRWYVYDSG